ncbi:uncharacterized protein LOC110106049 isoform X1 [Dendrobium catenatum]|uniref:Wings apart-like protein C-terminal domain-containing protein n=1 Tax=Dendrobium catenatum TaxID=906689 RepID=A0A2I0VQK7_9ASPA|nr:uncharacterized protein LOC110106049 isoform X1 [Dendrobium catenatum]PKU65692.1 hypothetical protein MA16_Dca009729 [Dendrobium catenatum]
MLLGGTGGREMMELVDEVNFALYGFRPWRPVRIRRTSLLSLLNIRSTEEGRRLIRERGMANMIVDAILDLNFDDTVCSIGAAALFYILASDVEDHSLLDSPTCVHFLLKLLSTPMESVEKKTMNIGLDLLEIPKPQTVDSANKGVDSTCRAIISKVKELLLSCNEIQTGSDNDDGMKIPELSSKWIALLIMEKACLSSVSFEDTTEMKGNVWGDFKETFRELKGLDAIFDVVTNCHFTLESWFKKKSASVLASKDCDSASLESVVLLLKSLKIMENATFMSEDNQNYLLKMKAKLNSGGVPLSFVDTVISCIKFLSGLSLHQSISSNSNNGKLLLSSSEACTNGKIKDVQDYPSTSYCGTKNSHLEKMEVCHKRHKLSTSKLEVSTFGCDVLSATDRTDCSASTSYNTTLDCSKGVSCRSTIDLKVKVHANSQRPSGLISIRSVDSKGSSHEQSKRIQITNSVKGDCMSDHEDPFAFDEDNTGPSKWEQFSSKRGETQSRKQAFSDKEYANGSEIPVIVIEDESSQPITEVSRQFSDNSFPSVDEKDPSLLDDCLLTSVKVLMNLTNDNPVGCQQIGACGGLDTLASLIASHFPSFDSCLPINTEIEESMTSFNRSNVSGLINDRKLHDHELDFLVAILGLLVNLVEKDSLNRLRLATARVLVNQQTASASKVIYRDVVPLLCSIFMSNQRARNADEEEEVLAYDDEASLLQSQREAEMMIIEAYTALLLAFLSTESIAVKETITRCLPNHRLEILVPVLERFVAFHLTLNMISPETHSAVVKVIESCKEP